MIKGYIIWLTGLSGAGKTTLANLICKDFERNNIKNQLLDGETLKECSLKMISDIINKIGKITSKG